MNNKSQLTRQGSSIIAVAGDSLNTTTAQDKTHTAFRPVMSLTKQVLQFFSLPVVATLTGYIASFSLLSSVLLTFRLRRLYNDLGGLFTKKVHLMNYTSLDGASKKEIGYYLEYAQGGNLKDTLEYSSSTGGLATLRQRDIEEIFKNNSLFRAIELYKSNPNSLSTKLSESQKKSLSEKLKNDLTDIKEEDLTKKEQKLLLKNYFETLFTPKKDSLEKDPLKENPLEENPLENFLEIQNSQKSRPKKKALIENYKKGMVNHKIHLCIQSRTQIYKNTKFYNDIKEKIRKKLEQDNSDPVTLQNLSSLEHKLNKFTSCLDNTVTQIYFDEVFPNIFERKNRYLRLSPEEHKQLESVIAETQPKTEETNDNNDEQSGLTSTSRLSQLPLSFKEKDDNSALLFLSGNITIVIYIALLVALAAAAYPVAAGITGTVAVLGTTIALKSVFAFGLTTLAGCFLASGMSQGRQEIKHLAHSLCLEINTIYSNTNSENEPKDRLLTRRLDELNNLCQKHNSDDLKILVKDHLLENDRFKSIKDAITGQSLSRIDKFFHDLKTLLNFMTKLPELIFEKTGAKSKWEKYIESSLKKRNSGYKDFFDSQERLLEQPARDGNSPKSSATSEQEQNQFSQTKRGNNSLRTSEVGAGVEPLADPLRKSEVGAGVEPLANSPRRSGAGVEPFADPLRKSEVGALVGSEVTSTPNATQRRSVSCGVNT